MIQPIDELDYSGGGQCGVAGPGGGTACQKAKGHTLSEFPEVMKCANPYLKVSWCGFCMDWSCVVHRVNVELNAVADA